MVGTNLNRKNQQNSIGVIINSNTKLFQTSKLQMKKIQSYFYSYLISAEEIVSFN